MPQLSILTGGMMASLGVGFFAATGYMTALFPLLFGAILVGSGVFQHPAQPAPAPAAGWTRQTPSAANKTIDDFNLKLNQNELGATLETKLAET